jgi:hypothetical protein
VLHSMFYTSPCKNSENQRPAILGTPHRKKWGLLVSTLPRFSCEVQVLVIMPGKGTERGTRAQIAQKKYRSLENLVDLVMLWLALLLHNEALCMVL